MKLAGAGYTIDITNPSAAKSLRLAGSAKLLVTGSTQSYLGIGTGSGTGPSVSAPEMDDSCDDIYLKYNATPLGGLQIPMTCTGDKCSKLCPNLWVGSPNYRCQVAEMAACLYNNAQATPGALSELASYECDVRHGMALCPRVVVSTPTPVVNPYASGVLYVSGEGNSGWCPPATLFAFLGPQQGDRVSIISVHSSLTGNDARYIGGTICPDGLFTGQGVWVNDSTGFSDMYDFSGTATATSLLIEYEAGEVLPTFGTSGSYDYKIINSFTGSSEFCYGTLSLSPPE